MKTSTTSATDFGALLADLVVFLSANGWAATHNPSANTATLTNGNGHRFYVSSTTTTQNDFYTGSFTDREMRVAYEIADIGGAPGSSLAARSNDFQGPFPNAWFFTDDDASFCHVVAQTAAARYSHMSFGNLDARGLHETLLPFAAGIYWQYWSTSANYINSVGDGNPFNNPYSDSHYPAMLDGWRGTNVPNAILGIPDGLLDPSLFFTDGPIPAASTLRLCDREYSKTTDGNNTARFLDYLCNINNGNHTGGVILSPLPVVTNSASQEVRAVVGEYPSVALVNMQGLAPGQTLTFADAEWLVFPIKQFGTTEAAKFGLNAVPQPNSWRYGYAYRAVNG